MVWKGDGQNRLAKSLVTLIDDITQKFPGRDTRNDGTIGDPRHQAEGAASDHNPHIHLGNLGIVTALDITHDPAHGFDAQVFADSLRAHKDPRIKYVIHNGRIFSSTVAPQWEWRNRNLGPGDHAEHVHVSVVGDPARYDDPSAWVYEMTGVTITDKAPAFPPTLKRGDSGPAVLTLQQLLGISADGVFGQQTEDAVRAFQGRNNLVVDGIVGSHTWGLLTAASPFKAAASADVTLAPAVIDEVVQLAGSSDLAKVNWADRGAAPRGYIKGMAVTFARVYAKLKANDSAALVMAAQNSGQDSTDVLAWYADQFRAKNMDNSVSGPATLRHLFALLIGLGMRESSGQYNEGRDMSASNTDADTAEAGLFQMSWNARFASAELPRLFTRYSANPSDGFLQIFKEGVPDRQIQNAGTGEGVAFQQLCKVCPAFAAEAAAVGLRVTRKHWGPINAHAAEIRPEADALLQQVQAVVDAKQPVQPPVPGPGPGPGPGPVIIPDFPMPPTDPVRLILALLTLVKEKTMPDGSATQTQRDPFAVILPTLLNSVLSGKQLNPNDLLNAIITGTPTATTPSTPTTPPTTTPAQQPTDPIAALIPMLIARLTGTAAPAAPGTTDPNKPATPTTQPATNVLQNLPAILQSLQGLFAQQQAPGGTAASPQSQIQKILDVLKALASGAPPQLGQVNGALGQTIGNLLDGKKSAIGIIGAVVTAILQLVGPSAPITSILPFLKPIFEAAAPAAAAAVPGLGSVLLPIFLAITAWGVLGKLEKWTGNSAAPPPPK